MLATDVLAEGLEALASGHPHADRLATHAADLGGVDAAARRGHRRDRGARGLDVLVNNAGLQPDGPRSTSAPATSTPRSR